MTSGRPNGIVEIALDQALIVRGSRDFECVEAYDAFVREVVGKLKNENRAAVRAHDLRGTFVTLSLAAGRSETWVADRTGHTSSQMINRYRRAARSAAELGLGSPRPLDFATPNCAPSRASWGPSERSAHPPSPRERLPRDCPRISTANWVSSMNVRSALVIELSKKRKQRESGPLKPPLLSHLLARAEQWQREIDSGSVRNRAALARREGLSQVYVGHLLRLVLLHPDIKAAIRALPPGTPSRAITERKLRAVVRLPWEQQLARLAWLVKRTG